MQESSNKENCEGNKGTFCTICSIFYKSRTTLKSINYFWGKKKKGVDSSKLSDPPSVPSLSQHITHRNVTKQAKTVRINFLRQNSGNH